ncbi:MAG: hypothetical protein AAGE59_36440 [Cyanobacteria bacterium P01_F01_bin.86]
MGEWLQSFEPMRCPHCQSQKTVKTGPPACKTNPFDNIIFVAIVASDLTSERTPQWPAFVADEQGTSVEQTESQ